MAGELVLLTGATGFIGFVVLRKALEAGFAVRAAVRSEEKGKKLQNHPEIKALNSDSLFTYIVVPDFEPPNAFDKALEGVKYVIHVASPASQAINSAGGADLQAHFVDAAVNSTVSLLESAKKAGSVERIVITSSAAAVLDMRLMFDFSSYDGKAFTADNHPPEIPGPYQDALLAYAASKIDARNAVEKWVQEQKPSFDAIQIHPGMVLGRDGLAKSFDDIKQSTNMYALMGPLGQSLPFPFAQGSVHVDDVAIMHVDGLKKSVPGNQSYLAISETPQGAPWNHTKEVARKFFPKAIEDGTLPNNGDMPSLAFNCDVTKEEKAFRLKFQGFEAQVKSAIEMYLDIVGHAKE